MGAGIEFWGVFWTALGSLIAGVAVAWSIFSWIVDKRDKAAKEEKDQFYKNHYEFETRIESQLKEQRLAFEGLRDKLVKMETAYAVNHAEQKSILREFREYVKHIHKIVEDHGKMLTNLGKVIDLEKK